MIQRVRQFLIDRKAAIRAVPMLMPNQSNEKIAEIIRRGEAALIGRMGWVEGYCTGKFLVDGKLSEKEKANLQLNAGVFSTAPNDLKNFFDVYLDGIANADILGLIDAPFHGWLMKSYAKRATLVELPSLEPYFFDHPWSWHLQGKTVLVVHPFAASIEKQYSTVRERIFKNPKVLPEFRLKLINAPQTISSNKTEYSSWFEAFACLEKKIQNEKFDIAILGCGAYGLPLGASIKKMGKIAIHLGGATQLFFGISGERWRNHQKFQKLINDSWSSPLEEERPPGWEKIEGGAYW